MAIEPRIENGTGPYFQKKVISVIVNMFGVGDLYPDDVVEKWILTEVTNRDGAWFDLFEEEVAKAINRAQPGDAIHDALTSWAEANNYVKSKVPLDERRYG